MESIDINQTVKTIIDQYPTFKQVLIELELTKVTQKNMLNTMGRFTPLKQGIKLKKVSLERLQQVANKHGFQITETKS